MLNQEVKMRKYNFRGIAIITAFALLCTGCGKKEAELVTGYGGSTTASEKADSEAGASEKETSGDSSTQEKDTSGPERTGELPATQLSGDPIWEGNFSADGIPVEISIDQLMRDMDIVHVYKMNRISAEDVREDELVKTIFGDSAKEVKRNISAANGDALRLVWDAGGFLTSMAGTYDFDYTENSETSSWEDSGNYYWHTYQGTYMGVDYQLGIGYNEEGAEEMLSLYPVNPGDVIGVPSCNHVEEVWFSVDTPNSYYWNGVFLKEAMKDRPNRTQSTEEQLCEMVMKFGKDVLSVDISREDICSMTGQNVGSPQTNELFFYSDADENDQELSGAVLDGYSVTWDMFHGGDYAGMMGNYARMGVTDKGVMGGTFVISYNVIEELTGNAEVLKFDAVMESLSEYIRKDFDKSRVNGQKIKIHVATLVYYPVENKDNLMESTLVPAWSFNVVSNGIIAEIYINALDGSALSTLYLN